MRNGLLLHNYDGKPHHYDNDHHHDHDYDDNHHYFDDSYTTKLFWLVRLHVGWRVLDIQPKQYLQLHVQSSWFARLVPDTTRFWDLRVDQSASRQT